jgi:hypothetical protein
VAAARAEADAAAGERARCSVVGGDHDEERREKEEDSRECASASLQLQNADPRM